MPATPVGAFAPATYVSLAFLFGIAAQFRAMDGYAFLRRLLAALEPKVGVLFAVSVVTFVFSPFILNDVLVLIMTPAIIAYAKAHDLDAAPLIVAEVTFTNISSSLTPIGNPQNILLWTSSGIGFMSFVRGTWLFVFVSGALAALALLPLARKLGRPKEPRGTLGSQSPALYLGLVTAVILVSDAVGLPSYVSLGVAFVGGSAFNLRNSAGVRREFDLKSLVTLYFFVAATTVAAYFLADHIGALVAPAAEGQQPYSGVFLGLVSNVVSNVPATQLLINTTGMSATLAPKIAVEAGLAGSLGPVASFANLLALQMAARGGVSIRKTVALQAMVGLLAFAPALA